jgi:hypothetical protein
MGTLSFLHQTSSLYWIPSLHPATVLSPTRSTATRRQLGCRNQVLKNLGRIRVDQSEHQVFRKRLHQIFQRPSEREPKAIVMG